MIRHYVFENVHYWQVARSLAGKYLYSTGFFFLDPFLIDCGPVNMFHPVSKLFQQLPATKIIITHHHEDHTGNLSRLLALREMSVFAHSRSEELLGKASREIPFWRKLVWGRPEPAQMIPAPEILETAQYGLQVLSTPGHSDDHICLFEPVRRWLFTGDLYLASYLRYLRDDENIYEIMESLRKVIELKPQVVFCGHRGFIPDGERQLSKKLAFLETLRDEVLQSQQEGMPMNDFLERKFKGDRFFRWLSRGEFCTQNLVRAFVR